MEKTINGLALCSGIGGLELGLHFAIGDSYRTICFVEREIPVAGILAARMADGHLDAAPVWGDLATFDGRRWRGVVDIVSAGYPCQPFSVAGKRQGAADPRHLWPHVRRVVEEVGPVQVFLENVGGHLRLGFREIAADLRGMGYEVAAGLFTAAEVGAPHRRERLFILADLHGHERRERDGESRHQPAKSGEGLANAARELRDWCRPTGAGRRTEPSDRIGAVEYAARLVLQGLTPARSGLSGDSGAGATGHADRPRPQGRLVRPDGESGERPAWPPGPSDRDKWSAILSQWPSLEPAVRGMVDGSPARVDRLRALGNGVVPVVAAYAYRTLAETLVD